MNKLSLSLAKLVSLIIGCSILQARKSAGWDTDQRKSAGWDTGNMIKIICSFDEASLAAALSAAAAKKQLPKSTGAEPS